MMRRAVGQALPKQIPMIRLKNRGVCGRMFSYVVPAADTEMTHVSLGIGLKSNGDGAELRVKEEWSVEVQSGFYESGYQDF
jgi:hypothetical protein